MAADDWWKASQGLIGAAYKPPDLVDNGSLCRHYLSSGATLRPADVVWRPGSPPGIS